MEIGDKVKRKTTPPEGGPKWEGEYTVTQVNPANGVIKLDKTPEGGVGTLNQADFEVTTPRPKTDEEKKAEADRKKAEATAKDQVGKTNVPPQEEHKNLHVNKK